MSEKKKAIIIGAGPAGLTAAYELLTKSDIQPIILEKDLCVGGISRTVEYKGNRIDIGGHRFFSKSDRVMEWWSKFLPVAIGSDDSEMKPAMLVRSRKSRIFFLRRFFDYPVQLSLDTLRKLGFWRMIRIGLSYVRSIIRPRNPVNNLEDFFVNRFGVELYKTFFQSYTEKVWGVPCQEINPEWGAQRIKGLSVKKAIVHFLMQIVKGKNSAGESISQKNVETSLIDRFLYPKLGPGQMWDAVAEKIERLGGKIYFGYEVYAIESERNTVRRVAVKKGSETEIIEGDYFFSSMPIKDLVASFKPVPPPQVREVASGLQYRDFITVGLLLSSLKMIENGQLVKDNWIYVQEPDVQVGRIQIFNNWSPHLVANSNRVWIGLEYFCFTGDSLWQKTDSEIIELATEEMIKMGLIEKKDVCDAVVIRMEKTYPAYFGSYQLFSIVRQYLDQFGNLFLVGRNGMHRYNNQDHSMLSAMTAVDHAVRGIESKEEIWRVNAEEEYHEEK